MHYGFRFLLAVLAVWRLTHLVAREDGPWDALARLRRALRGGIVGTLVSCFYCLSFWVAVPFVFFVPGTVAERFVVWLALSAAACLLEKITGDSLNLQIKDDLRNEDE
jgi:Protein of unknown function (DUF1360)